MAVHLLKIVEQIGCSELIVKLIYPQSQLWTNCHHLLRELLILLESDFSLHKVASFIINKALQVKDCQ